MEARTAVIVEVTVEELRVGLPLDTVAEVLRMVDIHDLPGAPAVVAGTVDVRGSVLPVLDLRHRLGRPRREPRLDDRLVHLVPGDDQHELLLWADSANHLRTLDPADISPLEDGLASSAHLAGVARLPDGLLYLSDVPAFLDEREQADLSAALGHAGPGA